MSSQLLKGGATLNNFGGLQSETPKYAAPPKRFELGATYAEFHELADREGAAIMRDNPNYINWTPFVANYRQQVGSLWSQYHLPLYKTENGVVGYVPRFNNNVDVRITRAGKIGLGINDNMNGQDKETVQQIMDKIKLRPFPAGSRHDVIQLRNEWFRVGRAAGMTPTMIYIEDSNGGLWYFRKTNSSSSNCPGTLVRIASTQEGCFVR